MRMFIISMIFMGIVEGFVVCQLSLIILRRLRFPIQKPAPVHSFYPPRWSGAAAFIFYLFGNSTLAMPQMTGRQEIMRVVGQVGACAPTCIWSVSAICGTVSAPRLLAPGPAREQHPDHRSAFCDPAFFHAPRLCLYLAHFHDWVVGKVMERVAKEQKEKALMDRQMDEGCDGCKPFLSLFLKMAGIVPRREMIFRRRKPYEDQSSHSADKGFADKEKHPPAGGHSFFRPHGRSDLVTLPEMFACPYETKNFRSMRNRGRSHLAGSSALAAEYGIYLSAGSILESVKRKPAALSLRKEEKTSRCLQNRRNR